MTSKNTHIASVSDSFAFALLELEQTSHAGQNVVLSPLSVSIALAMTLNGSRGKTRHDTSRALGLGDGRSLRQINESFASLRDSLAATTEVDLAMANSMIGCSGLGLKKNFLNKSQQYFDARIRLLDYDDPGAVVVMNSFICQKTKGKIPAIIDEIDREQDALHLLNAVYFRGFWYQGFNRLLTQAEQFKRLDGSTGDTALMYREGTFSYLNNVKFQAVRLPYGKTGRFSMYVFLPATPGEQGVRMLKTALADGGISDQFKRFTPRRGKLFLPRFKYEYASTLNQSLGQLGLVDLFDGEKSDIGSLAKSKQSIILRHKTVIQVAEDGSDALSESPDDSCTACGILPRTAFEMRVDRPFYFFVRDEENQSVSLAGFVNDPAL